MLSRNYICTLFLWLLLEIWNYYESFVYCSKDLPTIIWWSFLIHPHLNETTKIQCSKGSCISTSKRSFQNKNNTLAFIFYGTDFNVQILPLPRNSHHVWALLHEESPMNNYIFSHLTGIQLFNYTATFSRASDFPLTTQFIPSVEYLLKKPTVSTDSKNIYRKKGIAPVMYMQSHCNVASDRDQYVKELMKYIQIDSYGQCLHNKDINPEFVSTETYDNEALLNFISKYKFHIAFENAICDDYITEKLHRPLHVGSVPIYMGSPTVQDWAPSNKSVIVAKDFKSPAELAKYLKKLDENDDLYEEYLKFKHEGITNTFLKKEINQRLWGVNDLNKDDFIRSYECYICDKIISLNSEGFIYTPKIANRKHMNCPQPHRSINVEPEMDLTDEWWQQDWVEQYWFAFDQARALQMMIKNNENNTANLFHYLKKLKYKN